MSNYINDKTVNQKTGHTNPNYFLPDSEIFAGPSVVAFPKTHRVAETVEK